MPFGALGTRKNPKPNLPETIGAAAFGLGIAGAATNPTGSGSDADIAKKLTHELRIYPHYSIFDNVSFTLNEGRVDLLWAK